MSCAAQPPPVPPDIDRLDQHLLSEDISLQALVQRAAISPDDVVLDIGAGTGIITRAVAARARRTIAVEIDHRFRPWLDALPPSVTTVYGDARSVPLDPTVTTVVANPPFGLTEWLIQRLTTLPRLRAATLIMGRAFCDKAIAVPGSAAFGRLSLQIQARYDASVVASVPPDHFQPPARTVAGIVRLVPRRDAVLAPLADAFSDRGGVRLKSVLWRADLLGAVRSDPELARLCQRRLQEIRDPDLSALVARIVNQSGSGATPS